MLLRDDRYCHSVCSYAMCCTAIAHAATRCPVLTYRMLLRDLQYCHSVWCYMMRRTTRAYGATRCPVLTYPPALHSRSFPTHSSGMLLRPIMYYNLGQYHTPHGEYGGSVHPDINFRTLFHNSLYQEL
eukprot:292563-Rhodomonas_salina.1